MADQIPVIVMKIESGQHQLRRILVCDVGQLVQAIVVVAGLAAVGSGKGAHQGIDALVAVSLDGRVDVYVFKAALVVINIGAGAPALGGDDIDAA